MTGDLEDVQAKGARSLEPKAKLWSIAEESARAAPESDVLTLFIDSRNETIALNQTRVTAGVYARVPETVLLLQ